jgi:hypothetical protein
VKYKGPFDNSRENPHVYIETCNIRHGILESKVNNILTCLRGNTRDPKDMGLVGEVRAINTYIKIAMALITLIGVPIILHLIFGVI